MPSTECCWPVNSMSRWLEWWKRGSTLKVRGTERAGVWYGQGTRQHAIMALREREAFSMFSEL